MPLSTIFIFLVAMTVASLVGICLMMRRRHRQKKLDLEQEFQLQYLSHSTAYLLRNMEEQLEFIKDTSLEYNYASLEVLGKLGEGSFSKVYRARAPGLECEGWQGSDVVAVKILKDESEIDALQAFVSEVKISSEFQHQNVIKLIGVCTQTPRKCMIFEYMDLGNLKDILRQSDPNKPDKCSPTSSSSSLDRASSSVVLTPTNFLFCCLQVAQGLNYLAGLKFVHRDVATRNCLVNHQYVVKIADFGLSRDVSTMDYYRVGSSAGCMPVRWMSPEALLYGKFTAKSDVWSYGVLMWEVYTYAHQPYGGISNHEVINHIKSGHLLHCPDLCPASIYDIMKSCWTPAPQRRPQMARLLARISDLLRISRIDPQGDYTRMDQAGGYLNLNYDMQVGESELREKRRVDEMLQALKKKQEEERGEGDDIEDNKSEYVLMELECARVCGADPIPVKREDNEDPVDKEEEDDNEKLIDMEEDKERSVDGEMLAVEG